MFLRKTFVATLMSVAVFGFNTVDTNQKEDDVGLGFELAAE